MNRRQMLKGILVVPLLPLLKLAPVPAARLEHAWVLGGTAPPAGLTVGPISWLHCTVWNYELSQVEIWSLHECANGRHLEGCICEKVKK